MPWPSLASLLGGMLCARPVAMDITSMSSFTFCLSCFSRMAISACVACVLVGMKPGPRWPIGAGMPGAGAGSGPVVAEAACVGACGAEVFGPRDKSESLALIAANCCDND